MSSIFGTSVDDTSIGLNSTFLVGVTSTTEAIQILDQQLTIFNESNLPNGETAPLNTVINNLNTAITDVGDGLSNNLTATNVKTLYESNPNTNAFTDAYKTIVDNVGQYVDASELASALTPYRIATDQDTIDSGKYSTSNPAGYQTSSQVINSISDALVPYRTSADEDIINATKLNITDLKSNIVIHPTNAPTFLGVACCGGMANPGMARTSTGDITPLSIIPPFPSSDPYSDVSNGVVNFKGSNYYSYQLASGKAYTIELGGIYTNVSASTVFTTETATNDFVYKFATDGNILIAISKSTNSVHIFWTTDGTTWTPYFDNYTGGKRELAIFDGIVYIGTISDILKLSITDMQANAAYTMHNTGGLINSIVKTGPNTFVYLNENGMWISDLISGASAAIGFPAGATIGNESPGKITVTPWGLYANTGTGDNDVYKSTDGGFNWSVILTANPVEFYEVKTVFYSSDINVVLVGGYTNISTFLTLDSIDSSVYYPTGLNTNQQDSGVFYIFGFGNTYSGGGGGSGVSVLLDAGAHTTTNVLATLTDLTNANTEIRTNLGNYALSTDVTSEIAADRTSQDASIALTYESKSHASSTYLTILNAASQYQSIAAMSNYSTTSQMNTAITNANNTQNSSIAATYYLQTNPSGFITSSALSPYSTTSQMNTAISNANSTQDSSIASTYQSIAGMSNYSTTSQMNTAITNANSTQDSSIASIYQTQAAMSNYSTTSQMNTAITNANNTQNSSIAATYYLQTNPSGFITSSALSPYSTTSQMNTAISNANSTQDSSIAATYQSIAGMANYSTTSQMNTAISNANSTQDSSIASIYLTQSNAVSTYSTLTQWGYLLRPNIKIVVASGGSTTPATGQGYSTIESALAAAIANQTVFVCPGTYTLSSTITIPGGVSLRGFDKKVCVIEFTSTTNNTMITMGSNTSISDLTINHYCSTAAVDCNTISITGTNNINSIIYDCVITGSHTGASTGSMKLFSITATGVYVDPSIFTIKNCDLTTNANNTGANRVIHLTGTGTIAIDSSQMTCNRSAGSGTNFIAAEVNNASADLLITNSLLSGFTADVAQTVGSLRLGKSTVLYNALSNSLPFSTLGDSVEYLFYNGGNAAGNRWLTPAGEVNNAVNIRMSKPTIIYGLYFNARVLTTGVIDITIYKNGIATTLTCNATNVTSASNTTVAISFAAGDLLSVNANRLSGTITDYFCQFSAY